MSEKKNITFTEKVTAYILRIWPTVGRRPSLYRGRKGIDRHAAAVLIGGLHMKCL